MVPKTVKGGWDQCSPCGLWWFVCGHVAAKWWGPGVCYQLELSLVQTSDSLLLEGDCQTSPKGIWWLAGGRQPEGALLQKWDDQSIKGRTVCKNRKCLGSCLCRVQAYGRETWNFDTLIKILHVWRRRFGKSCISCLKAMTLRASSMVPRRATKLSQVKLRSLWSLWLQGGPEAADAWPSTLDFALTGSHFVNLCHTLSFGSSFCTQDKLPDTFAPTADERDMRDARRAGALQNCQAHGCCGFVSYCKLIHDIIPKDSYWNWQGWIKGDYLQNKWG